MVFFNSTTTLRDTKSVARKCHLDQLIIKVVVEKEDKKLFQAILSVLVEILLLFTHENHRERSNITLKQFSIALSAFFCLLLITFITFTYLSCR